MFLLSKNYRGNFYALIFSGLIFMLVGCDQCSIEPNDPQFDPPYQSPCATENSETNLLVIFPIYFAQPINSCMLNSSGDLSILQNEVYDNEITVDDVYTTDLIDVTKYLIQLNINGICESGEPFEEEFMYDGMDFTGGDDLGLFYIPEFERGDGSVTIRLRLRTPCAENLQSCVNCSDSAMELITAIREDVMLSSSPEIIFDTWDFQVEMTECDCL